jgi:tetratricopeptide (TPR) repeat protein
VIYWSGFVADDGYGPVDAGAHMYRSLLIDAHGNAINKRNAWAARALVYARLIPPGAADVGRFRVAIPEGARGPLTLTARMNYRKFSYWNTHFSFAGVRDPAVPDFGLSPHFDDGPFVFSGDTSRVSGAIKGVPALPITVIAENRVTLPLAGDDGAHAVAAPTGTARDAAARPGAPPPEVAAAIPEPQPFDRERWNDYGIGMLLQGDLVSAKTAFERVIAVDPSYADEHTNLGRVLVQEGDHAAALPHLERALALRGDLASARYFTALALKAAGRYDEALGHLRVAAGGFPRDRVVRNQMGRILFLTRRHREAIAEFEKTLAIDPEDLTAHYNLMLCYRALGETDLAEREETLYARFKADESAQAITGPYRRLRPEDNLERQAIHEHVNRYAAPSSPSRAERAAGGVKRAAGDTAGDVAGDTAAGGAIETSGGGGR